MHLYNVPASCLLSHIRQAVLIASSKPKLLTLSQERVPGYHYILTKQACASGQQSAVLQALSAAILGNLGSSGDEGFKQSLMDAGGLEKLQELSKSGSMASTTVRKAAACAYTEITTGRASELETESVLSNIMTG